jgi:hypothetical protein
MIKAIFKIVIFLEKFSDATVGPYLAFWWGGSGEGGDTYTYGWGCTIYK